jgi:hypothetical protein
LKNDAQPKPGNCAATAAASKVESAIALKREMRELERQVAAQDRMERQQLLAEARKKISNSAQEPASLPGDAEALLSILTWLELLSPSGGHPTYILQAWTGWQYRQCHGAVSLPMGVQPCDSV